MYKKHYPVRWPLVYLIVFCGLERSLQAQHPATPDLLRTSIANGELPKQVEQPSFDDRVIQIHPFGIHRNRKDRWDNAIVECSPDNRYLAIGQMSPPTKDEHGLYRFSPTGRIELWNLQTQKQIILEDGIKTPIDPTDFRVAFSPDGTLLAAASSPGQVNIWDLTEEPIADPQTIEFKPKLMNAGIATALCFAPDSKSLIVGTPWLRAIDVATALEIEILDHKDVEIRFGTSVLDFTKDSRQLAVATHSGVDLYDTHSGKVDRLLDSSVVGRVSFFKFLPDNNHAIVLGDSGRRVYLCNVRRKSRIASISVASDVASLAVSADGQRVAIKDVAIRQSDSYQEWRQQTRQGDTSNSVPVMISIWQIQEGMPVFSGQINTGTEFVSAIAMTPDGETLITVGQSLRFWKIGLVR